MRTKNKTAVTKGKGRIKEKQPRCLAIARAGIRTGGQFAEMMSALMSDIVEGTITPQVGNATVNAGGKLLKIVEMQLKYGQPNDVGARRVLDLVDLAGSRDE